KSYIYCIRSRQGARRVAWEKRSKSQRQKPVPTEGSEMSTGVKAMVCCAVLFFIFSVFLSGSSDRPGKGSESVSEPLPPAPSPARRGGVMKQRLAFSPSPFRGGGGGEGFGNRVSAPAPHRVKPSVLGVRIGVETLRNPYWYAAKGHQAEAEQFWEKAHWDRV